MTGYAGMLFWVPRYGCCEGTLDRLCFCGFLVDFIRLPEVIPIIIDV